jgi:SAM-dependent methyltransferase
MTEEFFNVYDDSARAAAYAGLAYPGTYGLAFRDLPAIIATHVQGTTALDFGCGAGRSTRFLKELGFDAVGVDISDHMLELAHKCDPEGDYQRVQDSDLEGIETGAFDLVLSAFTFDNIPTMEKKVALLSSFGRLLKKGGRIVNLVSAPEIYVNEWVSFSTRDFPENRVARSGDKVRIVMLDVEDRRPVEDIFCTDSDYREMYRLAGLTTIATCRPLGKPGDAQTWVNETTISPWAIYVLGRVREFK